VARAARCGSPANSATRARRPRYYLAVRGEPRRFFSAHWDHEPPCGRRCLAERGDDGSRGFQPTVCGPKNELRRGATPERCLSDNSRVAPRRPTVYQSALRGLKPGSSPHWGHEPDNGVGARLCEPQRDTTAPSPAGHRPALRDGRFMESPDAIFSAHWDHEPDLHESLNDE